jgi:hypothetical protein
MSTENSIQNVVRQIIELGNSLKELKGGPFPTDLISTLGELQVYLELKKRFPNHKLDFKRKARADISLDSFNIEVKTSNLKKEDYGEGYGFALHVKKCKVHPESAFDHRKRKRIPGDLCYLDYLICVATNENDLLNPNYYIFSRDDLNSNASRIVNRSKRFWFAPYRILIPIEPDAKQKGIIYNDFDLRLRENTMFKNNWRKIKV